MPKISSDMIYYSQAGQDKWIHEMIGDKGFFVDCGAYDGIQTSNTYALENLGWKGICIEANPQFYQSLCANRTSINIHRAVTDHWGMIGFGHDKIGGETKVPCSTLNKILSHINCPTRIDYLSLDIEGQETNALTYLDFDKYKIKLITVEHNLYCEGPANKDKIFSLLTAQGFRRVIEDVKCLDPNPLYFNQPFEDWYVNETFYK
jgi:FkbM family methyltransferase